MKANWSQLTEEQKKEFGNGCGLGVTLLHIRDYFFTANCRHHDFNYARGGDMYDRFKADRDFLLAMTHDIERKEIPLKEAKRATRRAILYYVIVRLFGWVAFSYGRYKTLDEVLKSDKK